MKQQSGGEPAKYCKDSKRVHIAQKNKKPRHSTSKRERRFRQRMVALAEIIASSIHPQSL
jgi:hypothetical protein